MEYKTDLEVCMSFILVVLVFTLILSVVIVYSSLSWGFILSKFWEWFLIPIFPEIPHISLIQAIGITFFICLFRSGKSTFVKDELEDNTKEFISFVIGPWILFLFGWIFKTFIM